MQSGDEAPDAEEQNAGERLASAYAEPDPEDDLPDPERELPNVPSVDIPTPSTSEDAVPGELLAGFWTTVLVFNVALLATCLGLLLLAFGAQRDLGIGALVVGLAAAAHGYWKYRSLAEHHRSGEWTDGSAAASDGDQSEQATDEPDVQDEDASSERNG